VVIILYCLSECIFVFIVIAVRRWEDNIKIDFQEIGVRCGNWIESAQDRDRLRALVSTVKNLRVP
jgi:hypothetical protein